ncbi:MAG: Glyoxylate reductase [Roseomonas sp.]|nr:Glyoxylate reductase [Roseomonas sp.]
MNWRVAFLDEDHVLGVARDALPRAGPAAEARLRAFFAPEAFDHAALLACGSGLVLAPPEEAEVVLLRRATVDAVLFERCPRLRLVQRLGERRDHIDLGAAAARGVAVSCLPRPTLIRTAEHAILLMLALVKRLREAEGAVRQGTAAGAAGDVAYNWPGLGGLGGLHGLTLGIVGLGEVGALVARRASAFGMRVLCTARHPPPAPLLADLGAEWRGLEMLLAESDIVSLHVSNLPENRGAMGEAELRLMRPGALLVNTSRGALLDEAALVRALREGRLGGAGLDVHAAEPRPAGDLLCALPNVVLTPHIAGGSRLGVLEEIEKMFANIRAVMAGLPPLHGRVLP